jgi:hypothetical protein
MDRIKAQIDALSNQGAPSQTANLFSAGLGPFTQMLAQYFGNRQPGGTPPDLRSLLANAAGGNGGYFAPQPRNIAYGS